MNKLPCDMVISFSKDGKFVWETDLNEGGRGQLTDNLIRACNKICDIFGADLDWEIGIVSIRTGNGIDNLRAEVERLSTEMAKVL